MTYGIDRWPGSDVLVVTSRGPGWLEESERILADLAAQSLVPLPRAVLFDLRLLEHIPSPEEARAIAARYGAFGTRFGCRMAYLALPGAPYGAARMIEMLTQQHGVLAATFTSPEPAVAWLGTDVRAPGA